MKNVAVFASGSGTNAENIARYFSKSETIKVALVLSNNRNVGVHARVNKLGGSFFCLFEGGICRWGTCPGKTCGI